MNEENIDSADFEELDDLEGLDDAGGSDDPSVEAAARAQGWRPEAEYKGDKTKWVDAGTFVERGRKFNSHLQLELDAVKTQLAAFKGTAEAFKKFHRETLDRKEGELADTLRQLKLQKLEATRNGDDEVALDLEDRIDVVKTQQQELKQAPGTKEEAATVEPLSTELQAWVDEGNDWFKSDEKMRAYAMAVGESLRKSGETAQNRAFLDKVTAVMREDFPHKFSNTNRQRPGAVEGSRNNAANSFEGKSERDLPAVDRVLMQKFVKEGLMTKAEFLKDYFTRG